MKKALGIIVIICFLVGSFSGCGSSKQSQAAKSGSSGLNSIPTIGSTATKSAGTKFGQGTTKSAGTKSGSGSSTSTAVKCHICNGTGVCQECKGTGKISRKKDSINLGGGSSSYNVYSKCPLCDGDKKCYKCGGKKYLTS